MRVLYFDVMYKRKKNRIKSRMGGKKLYGHRSGYSDSERTVQLRSRRNSKSYIAVVIGFVIGL